MDQPAQTSLDTVLYRSRYIFLTILVVFFGAFLGAIYTGVQSGEIKKDLEIIGKKQQIFMQSIALEPVPSPIDLQMYPTVSPTDEATPTPKIYYYQPPVPTATPTQTNYNYTPQAMPTFAPFPTFKPFPTAAPGAPGSKEWEAKFQSDSTQMQKDYQNMKAKICAQSPSLCN